MPKILGLSFGGWDSAAAVMLDGRLVAACEEERYTGVKHTRAFPRRAALDALHLANVGVAELDCVAINFDPKRYPSNSPRRDGHSLPQLRQIVEEQLGFAGDLLCLPHHECHVASALYPSGFDRAIVASFDALGESTSSLICAA